MIGPFGLEHSASGARAGLPCGLAERIRNEEAILSLGGMTCQRWLPHGDCSSENLGLDGDGGPAVVPSPF
jgi:hypothetical protein